MNCITNKPPSVTIPKIIGLRKPHIGKVALIKKINVATPTAVIVGITFGLHKLFVRI